MKLFIIYSNYSDYLFHVQTKLLTQVHDVIFLNDVRKVRYSGLFLTAPSQFFVILR